MWRADDDYSDLGREYFHEYPHTPKENAAERTIAGLVVIAGMLWVGWHVILALV